MSLTDDVFSSNLPSEVLNPSPEPASGWIAAANWDNESPNRVTLFETTWIVPKPPKTQSGQTQSGQLVNLFNSLQHHDEDGNWDYILQPVLQWGQNRGGGGNFWSIGCWYASSRVNNYTVSTGFVQVNEGDVLLGRLQLIEQSQQNPARFNYLCEFVDPATSKPLVSLTVQNIPELTRCSAALEAYNIENDDYYPNEDKISFANIKLQLGDNDPGSEFSWTKGGKLPSQVTIISKSEVQIFYPKGE